jgi:cytochrome P450/NADPH-cytochrome P450 reductase
VLVLALHPCAAFSKSAQRSKGLEKLSLGLQYSTLGAVTTKRTSHFIYNEELKQWEAEGVVSVRPCFSKVAPNGAAKQHVPDRMWEDRKELAHLFGNENGKIFICGSASKLARSTANVCKRIWLECHSDRNDEAAEVWLDKMKEDRYVSDVFE